jgi:hypothetical protein
VEAYNGTTWSTLANMRPHETATTTTLAIATNITRARFTYTKGNSNVTFDDVSVRLNGAAANAGMNVEFISVDACSNSCEGRDEFFTFSTGASAVSLANIEFTYPDANNSTVTWCGTAANAPCTNYISTSPSAVATLNTLAGCVRFISPVTSIPANSKVIVFNGKPQSTPTNFSSLCAANVSYYAVFANNTSDCNGRFGNYQTGGDVYRGLFIRDRGTGATDTVSYNRDDTRLSSNGSSVDGASVSYSTGTNYLRTNCTYTVLPITLTAFAAERVGDHVVVNWTTASEHNNARFDVERSSDGTVFNTVAVLDGAGESQAEHRYAVDDEAPLADVAYYRLKQVDLDGAYTYGPVVPVEGSRSDGLVVYPNPFTEGFDVQVQEQDEQGVTLTVVDALGRSVRSEPLLVGTSGHLHVDLSGRRPGLYHVVLRTSHGQRVAAVVKE